MNNSGYTSVKINDEEIGLRFGIPANRMFMEKIVSENNLMSGTKINEVGIATLMYSGYVNNCMVKDIDPIHKLGYFLEFIENAYVDDSILKKLNEIMECYSLSKFTEKTLSNIKDKTDELKKKVEAKKKRK